jgi:hypothetical protein
VKRLLYVIAVALGSLLVIAVPARAQTASGLGPLVLIGGSNGVFVAGDPAGVSASGLPPGTTASLYVESTPILIGTGVVAADGSVTVTGVIPADLASGQHHLVLRDGSFTLSSPITVLAAGSTLPAQAPATARSASSSSSPTLAFTGRNIAVSVAAALILLIVGFGLLRVGRQ